MSIGSRIREYRLKRGFTQSQMADKLDMTESNFSSYERDKSTPPISKILDISLILDVSVDYLLERTDIPQKVELSSDDMAEGYAVETNFPADKKQKDKRNSSILLRAEQELSAEAFKKLEDMAEFFLKMNDNNKGK